MKNFFMGLGILVMLFVLAWAVQGNAFFMYKFFAPKQAAVEREVFENTKSYTQGTIQEIRNYQMAYIQADKEHKAALKSVILHQVADFPTDKLPADLQLFISQLNNSGAIQ